MSLFRPVNSAESNLYTIRLKFKGFGTGGGGGAVDSTEPTNGLQLVTPTMNNLPKDVTITHNSASQFKILMPDLFTSNPTVFVTVHNTSSANKTADSGSYTYTDGELVIIAGNDNIATDRMIDVLITGPIKLGVTTGNSNKGWNVTRNEEAAYSYMNIGINEGNPLTTLAVNGTLALASETLADGNVNVTGSNAVTTTIFNPTDNIVDGNLPNGHNNQIKILYNKSANTVALTGTFSGSKIKIEIGANSNCTLQYLGTEWVMISSNGTITFTPS